MLKIYCYWLIRKILRCRFVLYYYSNYEFKEKEGKETKLTIETLDNKVTRNDMEQENEDWVEPLLESVIKTK